MKILWCFVFFLVFNNFQRIASKLQNENEETNSVKNLMQKIEDLQKLFKRSNNACLDQNVQRLEALEKSFEKNLQSQEQNFGALKTLLEESIEANNKRFVALEKVHGKKVERVDCSEQCAKDDSCVSVFWSNSSDSKCRFNHDKSTLVKFVPGEFYYCKDCQTTHELVLEALSSGVIKLTNVATNKKIQASSLANAMSDLSKAVDGDPNTWFSSKFLPTEGEPWLMVDLGQSFLVVQINIHVRTKPIHKTTGGYFQVCLVHDFDRNVNPCNQHSEILISRNSNPFVFVMKRVIMGRYVVIKMLKEDSLEIAELVVLSVIPIMS